MKRMSISTKTLLPLILITAIGIILNVVISVMLSKYLVIEEIKRGAIKGYKDTVLNALTTMMIAGNTRESKKAFLEQMASIINVKVIRSEALDKDFGKGEAHEYASDKAEVEVISSGHEKVFIDGDNIRGIYPYAASKNFMGKDCLGCHNVREGEVLGAISISISTASTNAGIARLKYVFIAVGLFGLILISVIFVYTFRVTHKPLVELSKGLRQVSEGDLSVHFDYDAQDEIGTLTEGFNQMVGNLKELVTEVRAAAGTMSEASGNLNSSSGKMANEVTNQAERTSQIASAIEEMSQTLTNIANNTTEIASTSNETYSIANDGARVVEQTITEVKNIDNTVRESARLVKSLGERSNQIGNIINVINDIADQTNLLALNAAIEAARAGQQGRGFAVVADEVRKLAEKTSDATKEIGGMITAMQKETNLAVSSMNENLSRVDAGVLYSTQAGASLKSILSSVGKLQEMLTSIATSTDDMSSVASQVTRDIDAIANSSRGTSVCSDVVSGASVHLVSLSGRLIEIVGRFKTNEEGTMLKTKQNKRLT
ncbi:MAG: methyl-accepting chemotaxis protein [Nitrospirae bacterium]|nr:methyl-accepting chemotaxis protein [Nitrospirota bacterium]